VFNKSVNNDCVLLWQQFSRFSPTFRISAYTYMAHMLRLSGEKVCRNFFGSDWWCVYHRH